MHFLIMCGREFIMRIKYDVQKLENTLRDFYNVTGLKILVLDTAFHTIVEVGGETENFCTMLQSYDNCAGCRRSDAAILHRCATSKKMEIHVCHAGLTNIALPIILKGNILGYVHLGQAREQREYREICRFLPDSVDHSLLEEYYTGLICYDRAQIESAGRMASMLTIAILAGDMIWLESEELSEQAADYIRENLTGDLSLEVLCSTLGVSKNLLYKSFRESFGCTVAEYITGRRIHMAKKLLDTGRLSIREVGEKVGIPEEAYFCRLFKKRVGCTPLQYRKESVFRRQSRNDCGL